eukprot:8774855-Ditylum_brightwellii.AAC.1
MEMVFFWNDQVLMETQCGYLMKTLLSEENKANSLDHGSIFLTCLQHLASSIAFHKLHGWEC